MLLNRKAIFAKICDKIDCEKKVLADMIRDAKPADEFYFGMYRLVFNRTDSSSGKTLYLLSLYRNDSLETRVLVDMRWF